MTDFSQLSEDQLILLVQTTAEGSAFNELVKLHQQTLMSFLIKLTQNETVAEDLMQDTFIKSYQNIRQFKASSSLKTWIFSIAYREFLSHVRKSKRINVILQSFYTVTELFRSSKQSKGHNITTRIDINNALMKLPENQRDVMILCDQLGMSHPEVAELLNIPLGTVKTHMRAARTAMKNYLGDPYEG